MFVVLHLRCGSGYPATRAASTELAITRGLSEAQIQELSRRLEAVADDCKSIGEGSLFQLTSEVKAFLDSAVVPSCVICYGVMGDLSLTTTLPGCLHSFDGPLCLWLWWSARIDEFESSPAEVAKREALQGKENSLAKLAEAHGASVAALEEKLATLPGRIEQAKVTLAEAQKQRDLLVSPTPTSAPAPSAATSSAAPASTGAAAKGKK